MRTLIRLLRLVVHDFKTSARFLAFWAPKGVGLWVAETVNTSRSPGSPERFVGDAWDPQLCLAGVPRLGVGFGPAFFEATVQLHAGELSRAFLYLNRGEGFSEASKIELIPLAGGRLGAIIANFRGVRGLRLDPSEGPTDVSIFDIRIRRATDLDAPLVPSLEMARLLGVKCLPHANLQGVSIVDLHGVHVTDQVDVYKLDANAYITFKVRSENALFGLWTVSLDFENLGAAVVSPRIFLVNPSETFDPSSSFPLSEQPAGHHRAVVALTGGTAVRWTPSEHPGLIKLKAIRAAPMADHALNDGSLLIDLSRSLTERLHGGDVVGSGDYSAWIEAHEPPSPYARRLWAAELKALTVKPLISILLPTYETPQALLCETIESVLAQVYPHWELCIADDASSLPHVRETIERYRAQDPRIKAVFRPRNGHISEASNSALNLVTADWLALLDHDDLFTPDALLAVAQEINAHPDAQFIYSDEDKLDGAAKRYEPFFKPDYSPELLRSQNYLNHLSVHRTSNVRAVGGWRKGYEGSQDYDLNLRILETVDSRHVRHIPKVLYHWRAVEGSTALAAGEKSYAFTNGLKALADHLKRMGWSASAEGMPGLPFYRVRYALPDPPPLVSVIVVRADDAALLRNCVSAVFQHTRYPSYEVLIVGGPARSPDMSSTLRDLQDDPRVRLVYQPSPFNYARYCNAGVAESRGEVVCTLGDGVEVLSPDWMKEMVGWTVQPRIGCVGAKLYHPNDTIQHVGVTLGVGGVAGHTHQRRGRDDPGYFGRAVVSHDVSAVTGACLFVRRSLFTKVGGMDERFEAFADVDFCIRIREAGYSNVVTPFAELYNRKEGELAFDNPSVDRAKVLADVRLMKERWGEALALDPFYSPNFSGGDYAL